MHLAPCPQGFMSNTRNLGACEPSKGSPSQSWSAAKTLKLAFIIAFSGAALLLLVRQDLVSTDLLRISLQSGAPWLAIACILHLSLIWLGTWRYRLILRTLGVDLPHRPAFTAATISLAIGQWVPGSAGAIEALRVGLMLRGRSPVRGDRTTIVLPFVMASMLDRAVAQAVMFVLGGVATLTLVQGASSGLVLPLCVLGTLSVALGCLVLFAPAFGVHKVLAWMLGVFTRTIDRFTGWPRRHLGKAVRLGERVVEVLESFGWRTPSMRGAIGINILNVIIIAIATYSCSLALKLHVPPLTVIAATPLLTLASLLPISFAGLGGQQLVAVGIFSLFSVANEAVAGATILYALVALAANTVLGIGVALIHAGEIRSVLGKHSEQSSTCSKARRVCYVLSYDDPNFPRTKSLVRALRALPGVELSVATNRRSNRLRYFETMFALLKLRVRVKPDCYILGFRGHEIFWLVRLIGWGRPLIFDELMSPSDALISEARFGLVGRVIGSCLSWIEGGILRSSSRILTDTEAQVHYLARRFNLPLEKITVVPVGADEERSIPRRPATSNPLQVLFYGSFMPLHGIETMLQAVARLRQSAIHFTFVGGLGAAALRRFHARVKELQLDNLTYYPWGSFDDLINVHLASTDLCLGGPFGGTPQARRVITGKTLQCLCNGKAVVIGALVEDCGFVDQVNCLLVEQASPDALAEKLLWAVGHREELLHIGARGAELYLERYSTRRISSVLEEVLEEVYAGSEAAANRA